MPLVRMYIDKFKQVVLIEDTHPLVVAQRAKDAQQVTPPVVGAEPTVQGEDPAPAPPPTTPAKKKRRR